MHPHRIVSAQEWLACRRDLLAKEKEFTRLRDELSRQRRELPWVRVTRNYLFEGRNGRRTLAQLFAGRSQLIVYHFMFGPEDTEGCPSCSYLADHFDGAIPHLAQRDVTLLVAARAPRARFEPFHRRMGWQFDWVSTAESEFNFDYHVSFTPEEMDRGRALYNFTESAVPMADLPGVSVFYRDEWGDIFHTYSAYARGLDLLVGTYSFLDLAPKGRDEDALDFSMSWVRHHDRYQTRCAEANACCSTSHHAQPVMAVVP